VREYTDGRPVHICRRCGFVYVVRRRSAKRIADVWSEEIFGNGYTAAVPAVTARLTFVAEFVDERIGFAGKRIYDIGAGEGYFLDMARSDKYDASVFRIEPSARNCKLLEGRGIDCFNGTIEEYGESPREDAEADVVTIMWTLENCQSCRGMLSAAHRILNPGGHVIVATGIRILVPFKKPLHDYIGSNPVDTHSFRFSANTLRGMLAVSGFEVEHVNRYLDSDALCVIACKVADSSSTKEQPERHGDDYLDVYTFFERWHADTALYFPREGGN